MDDIYLLVAATVIELSRRVELPTSQKRNYRYNIFLGTIFLRKIKLEIIFIELVERVTNLNDYRFLFFIFEWAFC